MFYLDIRQTNTLYRDKSICLCNTTLNNSQMETLLEQQNALRVALSAVTGKKHVPLPSLKKAQALKDKKRKDVGLPPQLYERMSYGFLGLYTTIIIRGLFFYKTTDLAPFTFLVTKKYKENSVYSSLPFCINNLKFNFITHLFRKQMLKYDLTLEHMNVGIRLFLLTRFGNILFKRTRKNLFIIFTLNYLDRPDLSRIISYKTTGCLQYKKNLKLIGRALTEITDVFVGGVFKLCGRYNITRIIFTINGSYLGFKRFWRSYIQCANNIMFQRRTYKKSLRQSYWSSRRSFFKNYWFNYRQDRKQERLSRNKKKSEEQNLDTSTAVTSSFMKAFTAAVLTKPSQSTTDKPAVVKDVIVSAKTDFKKK